MDAKTAIDAQVNLYDRLFTVEARDAQDGDFKDYVNPDSLKVLSKAKVEPSRIS